MSGEDPPERPDYVRNIIGGLERYNPEAAGSLEGYVQQQCEEKFCDCHANRALLKLYVYTYFPSYLEFPCVFGFRVMNHCIRFLLSRMLRGP